eukprot:6667792-Prymnesium_polylepis.1
MQGAAARRRSGAVRARGVSRRGAAAVRALDSARKPMMPSIASRPLLISARRPLAFFSSERLLEKPSGSYRSRGTGCGTPAALIEG